MEVISVPLTDQQKPVHNIRTRTFFILDDRLDEDILKNALDRLIRDHWRKLGARLVIRPEDERLEYHLPQTFGEKYVLFKWSSEEYDHSIDKVTSILNPPPPEKGVALLPPLDSIDSLFRPSDWPFEQKDDPPNSPLLYVHLSLFTDATAIAISCPHAVGDQFGMANIVKAWLGLTRGEAPPSMVGYNEDVLANGKSYADYPKGEVFRKGRMRVRRNMEYCFVLLGLISELVVHRKESSYTVFFPLPLVQSLRERHSKTLAEKYGVDPGISNGDILTGILTKFARMHDKSPRWLALSQAVNLRGRIPELDSERDAFINNSLHSATAHFRMDASTPLSEIAYLNRQAIIQAVDQKDIEIGMVVTREMVRRGQSTHICEPFQRSYYVSNWCGAWKGLDFSSATKGAKEGKERTTLKMFVLGQGKELKTPARFNSTIMCKTEEGFWCDFSASRKAIKLIKEYLAKDPMLENF